jgi:D-tyrosyl-tRNA(Tyr) deacylase
VKAVIQRVLDASVTVNGRVRGRIGRGLLVYLGVAREDSEADADWLAEKTATLRIFDDSQGRMNCSLMEIVNLYENIVNTGQNTGQDGKNSGPAGVLAVSQFTLLGDARKGRRPSWTRTAPPEKAKPLYEYFIQKIRGQGLICESGEFQALMQVAYTNDGPVTILLDSRE